MHDAVVRDVATGVAVVTLSATDAAHSGTLFTAISVAGSVVNTEAAATFDDFFVSSGSDDSDGNVSTVLRQGDEVTLQLDSGWRLSIDNIERIEEPQPPQPAPTG